MRLYTVHYRAFGLNPEKNLVVIKEGFSWLALFLGYGVITGVLMLFDASPTIQLATNLGCSVIIGFLANDLRRWTLERHDYDLVSVVSGTGIDDASRRFLDRDPEKAAAVYS
ncbi:MAG: DUF2628 domain-containing protein [Rhodospirillales bacterium]